MMVPIIIVVMLMLQQTRKPTVSDQQHDATVMIQYGVRIVAI